jgi:deoxyribodipyrimidine photo-lyase
MIRQHAPVATRPGEFVLYWMMSTFRAHDNFALDLAITQADALGLPLLVYHGLRRDYRWASARHHTFVLEGVVDLRADFAALGIPYVFVLETPASTGSPLLTLAERAALVVTDYVPTELCTRQIAGFRKRSAAPLVPVDSATIVPIRALDRAYSTARAIRPVLMGQLAANLATPPPRAPRVSRAIDLPFQPTPDGDIATLVQSAGVDPSVPPSTTLRGGTRAGRARLAQFVEHGLPNYHDRNDPNVPAVSKLSAYLHFGHVSPHEVIRTVHAVGSDNADKFVDEAVVWRELAHNFCHHDPRYATPAAIPEWAAKELAEHQGDPRELLDVPELEEARTPEPLWNAAMRQLRAEGWMHNYLRMLWGKALIRWTPDAATAFVLLVHLNNKWQLDGRDPSSYAGIHWVFGKFDRPFYRHPCFGTVRYMSLKAAKDKFDLPRFLRSV